MLLVVGLLIIGFKCYDFFQVFDRYHHYLRLHDFVQKLNVTLSKLEVVIKDPNEELLLETSENYTLTVQTNSAILQVSTIH